MFKNEALALALAGAFTLAVAGGALADEKKQSDSTQGSSAESEASAQPGGSKDREVHPGQAEAPGQSGTAPGQAGTTPGQSGNSPGQSGDTPGKQTDR